MKNIFKLFNPIKRVWFFLSSKRKFQFIFLLFLFFIHTFCEIISIGALIPYITVITNPDQIYDLFSKYNIELSFIESDSALVNFFTLAFIIIIILTALVKMITQYLSVRISYIAGFEISKLILTNFIYDSYLNIINKDKNEILSSVNSKVYGTISIFLLILQLINSILIVSSVIIIFLIYNFFLTFVVVVFFALIYFIITFVSKKTIDHNGKIISFETSNLYKYLRDSFGGIKSLIIDEKRSFIIDEYSKSGLKLNKAQFQNTFISNSPKIFVENIGIVLLVITALIITKNNNLINAVAILGLLAFSSQKLLPLCQTIFYAFMSVMSEYYVVEDVANLLERNENDKIPENNIDFKEKISFENLSYSYNNKNVFNKINIDIIKGKKIGIVGKTGSGKTTFVDIFMSLLEPYEGKVFIDGTEISFNELSGLRKIISHVPQNIYLSNSTVGENIAFGVRKDTINFNLLEESAKKAKIYDRILLLEDNFDSKLGDEGGKFSGGEKQRIVLARAFYKQAKILVFDEATSSLDKVTANEVMSEILKVDPDITIISITHRLPSIKDFDYYYFFENGTAKLINNYNSLD